MTPCFLVNHLQDPVTSTGTSLGALVGVQKEVVNTLIKRELLGFFFSLRNKSVNRNFPPFFPQQLLVSLEYISISALIC